MKILCALLAVLFLLMLMGGAALAGYSGAIQSFDVTFLAAIMLTIGLFGFCGFTVGTVALVIGSGGKY